MSMNNRALVERYVACGVTEWTWRTLSTTAQTNNNDIMGGCALENRKIILQSTKLCILFVFNELDLHSIYFYPEYFRLNSLFTFLLDKIKPHYVLVYFNNYFQARKQLKTNYLIRGMYANLATSFHTARSATYLTLPAVGRNLYGPVE